MDLNELKPVFDLLSQQEERLVRKIDKYIKDNNRTISACELVEMVLNIKGADDEVSNRLIITAIGNDNRFKRDKTGWSVYKVKKHAVPIQ